MLYSEVSGKASFLRAFWGKILPLFCVLFLTPHVPVWATDNLEPILQLVLNADDSSFQRDLLKGMREGLVGRRNLVAPPAWSKVASKLMGSADTRVREEVRLLGIVFGDETAIEALRTKALNANALEAERRRALGTLVRKKAQGLDEDLKRLLDDDALRIDALRGLAVFGGAEVPRLVFARYGKFNQTEKREAVQVLVSRRSYAAALLEAMNAGVVPRSDVSVFTARQILGFGDQKLNERLQEIWGELRPAADDTSPLFAKYRKLLAPQNLTHADLSKGRLVYGRSCAACHKLYGEGGAIGPDLTGSDRANLNYLLENVLDPNAAIVKDYLLNVLITKEGRVINGFITAENDASLTVQTVTGRILVSKQDLESRRTLSVSMMPEGIFQVLEDEEVRDLVAYLFGKRQVALPKEKK